MRNKGAEVEKNGKGEEEDTEVCEASWGAEELGEGTWGWLRMASPRRWKETGAGSIS
jgi:hypothetical protein